jgi:hypothetical protein
MPHAEPKKNVIKSTCLSSSLSQDLASPSQIGGEKPMRNVGATFAAMCTASMKSTVNLQPAMNKFPHMHEYYSKGAYKIFKLNVS